MDLSEFDKDSFDPDWPSGLDSQFISGLLEPPQTDKLREFLGSYNSHDVFEKALPHLRPEFFRSAEHQFIIAEILKYYEEYGNSPTRDVLWSIMSRLLRTDDPYQEIKDAIYRPAIAKESYYLADKVIDWLKKCTLRQAHGDEGIEAAINKNTGFFRDIADEADAVGVCASENLKPSELETETGEEEWLIDGILAPGQPCIIGGPMKSLKTSILYDLAVSLAAGKDFLDKYKCRQTKVLFISGESGKIALKHKQVAIRRQRHIAVEAIEEYLRVSFKLPALSTDAGLGQLQISLQQYEPAVVILDPLYLCLLSGDANAATNIYAMGIKLGRISRLCQTLGVTPILAHHFNRKGIPRSWPVLTDLSQAGAAEFCRQWILLQRARDYREDGHHELNVVIGGEGRSLNFRLAVDEGLSNEDWILKITPRSELQQAEHTSRQSKQVEKFKEEEEELLRAIRILDKASEAVTRNKLKGFLHWSGSKLAKVVMRGLEQHLVVEQRDGQTADRLRIPAKVAE